MSILASDLLFWWLPVAFLFIQCTFLLTLLGLTIYTVILRIRIDHEEQRDWGTGPEVGEIGGHRPIISTARPIMELISVQK